ncbi:MAG TPA: hypothetical protein VOA64_04285 [Candidatus Dormibacteraeota bacterium]|nr:hypothetical protein [Candidatus Dormibacteraeota bacterium]
MSKLKVLIAGCTVILFATAAVFPSVTGTGFHGAGKLNSASTVSNNGAMLSADGSDPQPPAPRPRVV